MFKTFLFNRNAGVWYCNGEYDNFEIAYYSLDQPCIYEAGKITGPMGIEVFRAAQGQPLIPVYTAEEMRNLVTDPTERAAVDAYLTHCDR